MLYIDDAVDRRKDRLTRDFDMAVESVRVGTVIAHDKQAFNQWQRRSRVGKQTPMSDKALELAIMQIAAQHPGNVVRGTLPRT